MEVCGVDSKPNPNLPAGSVLDATDAREVPAGTTPAARVAEGAAKASSTPTPTIAKGLAKPVAAKQTGATLIKLPIMPGGVPDTDTYIAEMDYIVNSFVSALKK